MKKLALVTGSSRGLGKEIAIALSKKFKVGIHYFGGKERAEETLTKIEKDGGEGVLIWGDLSTDKGVGEFINETRKNFGEPDILINNFGPIIFKNVFENELKDWSYILQTNLLTPFLLIREFLPSMKKKRWGRIINIGFSESSKPSAFKEIIPYSISKNALLILTISIAKILRNSGVTCNMISPYILEEGISPKGKRKGSITPFEEVTSIVLLICDEKSSNLNGRNFILKGLSIKIENFFIKGKL